MSTRPALMSDALDDLADAQASLEADEALERIELEQLNSALDYMRENDPGLVEFEAKFGKVAAAHLPQIRGYSHNLETVDDLSAYRVDPDSPSAKAARRMRKSEGL